ncbi:hypothetical protein IY230_04035 [Acholeplasma laidlawii]|uniref:hypothetical protein n=1 Tax=Acholeplasma laidlawii TaxID=2148 RepID=UPI0018C2E2DB|nr:hypothetical protein [Acholeplasma laidlawii]MBG0762777.1 hypothetical protein [Acholeplasma laidlawii]
MQILPTRSDNYLFNINAPWEDLGKFEIIGTNIVYYIDDDILDRYHKINGDEINIYKITKIHDYGSVTMIDEMFLIKVSYITAFDFVYEIEDFEL